MQGMYMKQLRQSLELGRRGLCEANRNRVLLLA